ncbi:MAG: hypothetical protein F4Y27_08110 [Acidimicrobiaceae bacterium]|nr:hypothetical protein [Acidimicrobiaceae bacterium]MYA74624.1 hypothetical protein [Acidimicrobiaceae bacterium]MYC41465.1 hypothetical protein [Acidimicrobiaceae bacterium]MYG54764.1 hypothetical protein [Acidimicrobiaceae bacterium]MYH89184.1 hypothetical protein [Acidimicrobiaceae bacterium]
MIHDLHEIGGWSLIAANGAVGIWALLAHRYERFRGRPCWIAIGIAQLIVVVQTLTGVAIQVSNEGLGGQHELYGFAAFVSVGIIFAYRNEMRDRPYLLFGLGSLWLMGLGIRAILLV